MKLLPKILVPGIILDNFVTIDLQLVSWKKYVISQLDFFQLVELVSWIPVKSVEVSFSIDLGVWR